MGKTVTTYLIDGDPKGTQYAFISNKICQMFVIPRSNLAYLNEQVNAEPEIYTIYKKDANGNYLRDEQGKKIPEEDFFHSSSYLSLRIFAFYSVIFFLTVRRSSMASKVRSMYTVLSIMHCWDFVLPESFPA